MRPEELFQRLTGTSSLMKKCSDRMLSMIDLTHGQAMILGFLFMNGNRKITQKDIEKNFELSHATVNGFMRRMEKKGLLTVRQDDCDRRFKVIEPTQKLLDLYDPLRQRTQSFLNDLNSEMPLEEQETLIYLLDKLEHVGKKHMESFIEEQKENGEKVS